MNQTDRLDPRVVLQSFSKAGFIALVWIVRVAPSRGTHIFSVGSLRFIERGVPMDFPSLREQRVTGAEMLKGGVAEPGQPSLLAPALPAPPVRVRMRGL